LEFAFGGADTWRSSANNLSHFDQFSLDLVAFLFGGICAETEHEPDHDELDFGVWTFERQWHRQIPRGDPTNRHSVLPFV